jgi:proline racemase
MNLRTIDAHAAGGPLRLVVDGFPSPRGKTMIDKREWASRHADHLRRALILEPRGHADMCGAVLTEPAAPGAHAGVLFFHNGGYSSMSGHGVIAVTTIVIERGLVMPGGDGTTIVFDTPAGTVRATATVSQLPPSGSERRTRVERVTFSNVPAFVLHAGVPVQLGPRHLRADVAYGGAFYAIVDAESAGVAIDLPHLPELRRAGLVIKAAIERAAPIAHPSDGAAATLDGTIFTGPSHDSGADLRNAIVFADGAVDRSPGGTGTSAVMAVIDAMGLLAEDRPFVHESLLGTRFSGRVSRRTAIADYASIVTDIEGSAWITGEHTFVLDEDDPFKYGFRS